LDQSALHDYRQVKDRLRQWFQSVAETPTASEVKMGSDKGALTLNGVLSGLVRQVVADTFKVAVVGEYSSGKSSLLNVLLRLHTPEGKKTEGLLPTAITPTTAVITTLVYDPAQSILLTLDDGTTRTVSADQLNGFLIEPTLRRRKFPWTTNAEENENLAERIRHVRIGCLSPLLGEGIELIDTPGIGSVNEDHGRITKEFTAEADAALFLFNTDPPMGQREMTFLQHIKSITDRCLFVQTKRDLGDRTEKGEQVWRRRETEHRRRIEEVIGRRDYPFYCVSAIQAAYGLRRGDDQEFEASGFAALEAELQRFLVAERGKPRLDAWVKRGSGIHSQIAATLHMEREQLEARLADSQMPIAAEEDYVQERVVTEAMQTQLAENLTQAEVSFAESKKTFAEEVKRETRRELDLAKGKQLAEDPDRLLKMEQSIVRSIQYHREDLLTPVLDKYVHEAQEAIKQTFSNGVPKVFQQFQAGGFDMEVFSGGVDLGGLVDTHTYIRETKRGGIGWVDFWLGAVKTEVTEHNIDTKYFHAAVEKAIDSTYRDAKSVLLTTLGSINRAAAAESDRRVTAAKNAADQQTRIQKQDQKKCQQQLQDNQKQIALQKQYKADLEEINSAVLRLEASVSIF
jgi:GTPase SAR1 family protein